MGAQEVSSRKEKIQWQTVEDGFKLKRILK